MSVSTVSRALNGQPFVRAEVRDRVLDASAALGYRPDVAARSMGTGTTGAVGFVVSDISNPLFASIAKAADLALSPRGYALMIANSANDPEHEAELIAAFRQRRLDGLIIATANEAAPGLGDRVASFQASVLLDREFPGSRADAVLSDHGAGLGEAIRYLADLGHRRIALIAGTAGAAGQPGAHPTYGEELARLGIRSTARSASRARRRSRTGTVPWGKCWACPIPPPRSSPATTSSSQACSLPSATSGCAFPTTSRWWLARRPS